MTKIKRGIFRHISGDIEYTIDSVDENNDLVYVTWVVPGESIMREDTFDIETATNAIDKGYWKYISEEEIAHANKLRAWLKSS